MTGDEMVGWHHQLDGHEFEQALGAGILWIKENQISQVKEFSSSLYIEGLLHARSCSKHFSSLQSLSHVDSL